jgi:hypothetical protein
MRGYFTLVCTVLWLAMNGYASGQTIQGQIIDVGNNQPLADVAVQNIHTENGIRSDDDGKFALEAGKGQLVEFRKAGYKVLRVRLPNGTFPAYFKVVMEKQSTQPMYDPNGVPKDYAADSAKYYALYKREVEYPKMTTMDVIRHPFSAMSKRSQEIWEFQKEFEFYQQQKYIDYTFNHKLVNTITGLSGDSLQAYMQMFRPTYQQLRSMNEYTYYNYIKVTVTAFRERGIRAKQPPGRGTR